MQEFVCVPRLARPRTVSTQLSLLGSVAPIYDGRVTPSRYGCAPPIPPLAMVVSPFITWLPRVLKRAAPVVPLYRLSSGLFAFIQSLTPGRIVLNWSIVYNKSYANRPYPLNGCQAGASNNGLLLNCPVRHPSTFLTPQATVPLRSYKHR